MGQTHATRLEEGSSVDPVSNGTPVDPASDGTPVYPASDGTPVDPGFPNEIGHDSFQKEAKGQKRNVRTGKTVRNRLVLFGRFGTDVQTIKGARFTKVQTGKSNNLKVFGRFGIDVNLFKNDAFVKIGTNAAQRNMMASSTRGDDLGALIRRRLKWT
uniref:uncharacterized protein LOC120344861 n=1 Tax=Styela clava TaxID=7725 RepID=UPI001939A6E3|nr:uncharacterized protein LOC120344861 [Styela clava]